MVRRMLNKYISLTLLFCNIKTCYSVEIRILETRQRLNFAEGVILKDAEVETSVQSTLACFAECSMNVKCLTFFYNRHTGHCVMHSKDFLYPTTITKGKGWKFYVTKDVSGRCPSSHYFYRHLEFCYNVQEELRVDYSNIKRKCMDIRSKLSTVTSQELQDYFSHVLKGRNYERVCLDGRVYVNSNIVRLDNGTQILYSNWYNNQPDWNYQCLELYLEDKWFNYQCWHNKGCVFICQH